MIFKKGHIICQSDYGLELRKVVEEFLEIGDMSKRCLNQYISIGNEVLELKEKMKAKSEASGLLYYISISRWFDYRLLKKLVYELNSNREGLDRSLVFMKRKLEEYHRVAQVDNDTERAELFRNVFIEYVDGYLEYFEKQVELSKTYAAKIKSLETVTDSVKGELTEIIDEIVKHEKRVKLRYNEINDVWFKISDELMSEIVDNVDAEKIKDNRKEQDESESEK